MRIAVTGTNGIGKSTLISDMLETWASYETPSTSFRDDIDDKYITDVTEDRQRAILDSMVTQLKTYGKSDSVLYDRCPVDNMVYTLYGYAKEEGDITEEFVLECAAELKIALRMIDLILFIPITKQDNVNIEANLEDKGDLDLAYAKEIDHIFKSIYREWDKRGSPYVDFEDKPHVIEIFGTPEERLELMKMYIDTTGDAYGEGLIIKPDELEGLHHMDALLAEQEGLAEDTKFEL